MGIFATPPVPQVYANQARAEAELQQAFERDRLARRGRELAGFVQRDRRADGLGFVWQRQRAAAWPAQLPEPARRAVEQAISADHQARAALESAGMQFRMWEQQHPTASDERRRVKYEELTEDLVPAAQKAASAIDAVLTDAAALVEAIEAWHAAEQAAPGRRTAAEQRYQQELSRIETELMTQRAIVQRAGVQV